jgi:hypothetical protein
MLNIRLVLRAHSGFERESEAAWARLSPNKRAAATARREAQARQAAAKAATAIEKKLREEWWNCPVALQVI